MLRLLVFLFAIFLLSHDLHAQKQFHYPDTIYSAFNTVTKTSDQFYGGTRSKNGYLVPLNILFHTTDTFVSLPAGSYVVLGLKDHYIFDAPDHADIYIEEAEAAGEFAEVYVSHDHIDFTFLGKAECGKVNQFDLATIQFDKPVSCIKIVGQDPNGTSPGFDVKKVFIWPEAKQVRPSHPVVLKNILFATNESTLLPASYKSLDTLATALRANQEMKIEIRGHTDSVGTDVKNQELSLRRAKSVANYLIASGIDRQRLGVSGYGSTQPIASNHTEEGRRKNRRVEFVQIQ